jgi:hypothetical protein
LHRHGNLCYTHGGHVFVYSHVFVRLHFRL